MPPGDEGAVARRDALFREVLAQPDRDEPRLQYARYLESEGDVTGEFIRLATEIQHPKSGYVAERTNRFIELKHLEAAIAAPLAPWIKSHILSRGLVSLVEMDARTYIDAGHEVFARAPVQHLDLVNAKPVFAELVACPLLARVKTLRIAYGELGDAEAALLAGSPHVRQLQYLALSNNQIGEAGLEAITASPHLAGLRVLRFFKNVADDPVTREGTEISGDPFYEPAGPIQARLEAKYGRKVWMHQDHTSPSRFDIGRPTD